MRPMKRCEWKSAAKRVVLQKVIKPLLKSVVTVVNGYHGYHVKSRQY